MKKLFFCLLLLPGFSRAACPGGTYATNVAQQNMSFVWVTNSYCVPNGMTFDDWQLSLWPPVPVGVPFAADDLWLQITNVSQDFNSYLGRLTVVDLWLHGLVVGETYHLEVSTNLTKGWMDGGEFIAESENYSINWGFYGESVPGLHTMAFFRLKGPRRPNRNLVEFSCGLFLATMLRKGIFL